MLRQDNTYNNVRDPVFSLVKQIRSAPVAQLKGILKTEIAKLPIVIEDVSYWAQKNSDLLHILARLLPGGELGANQQGRFF